jgi:SAM-dependent methyltransferase
MHAEAYYFVKSRVPERRVSVLEIGSRNVNGEVRHLFDSSRYVGLDIEPGPGVDVVADASVYETDDRFDVIVCCEVLEHTPVWAQIVARCGDLLRPAGHLILTCAGPGRAPHGAGGGGVGDEHYANISVEELEAETSKWGDGFVRQVGADTQAFIVKRV